MPTGFDLDVELETETHVSSGPDELWETSVPGPVHARVVISFPVPLSFGQWLLKQLMVKR